MPRDPNSERAVIPHARPPQLGVSSPSQRVAELSAHINQLDNEIAKLRAENTALKADYDRFHRFKDTSFAGVPMAQYWCDLVLWEAILNTNEHLRGIVEIGTWEGGLSGWLWAQARLRGMSFVTFDVTVPTKLATTGWTDCYRQTDVFAEPEFVEAFIAERAPVVLLCDGGNKPRELETFGPMVGPEGLVVVHDWGTEMLPADVPDTMSMEYGAYCDLLGSVSRVFRVKQ